MRAVLETLCRGEDLSAKQAESLFRDIVRGEAHEVVLAALLVALKTKGETPEEVAGAALALRAEAAPFDRPDYLFADCCGTGGDGVGTINVSTAVAFVAAEAGLPVAKHGNRAVSSRAGSADVLLEMGACIDIAPEASRRALDDLGFCFLFAPKYHAGLRHAMGVRRALGVRTVMNVLGPLVNPSRPPVQLVGVYDASLVLPVVRTLALLGCRAALVVHGDGLDEIALHAPTTAAILRDGEITPYAISPEMAGIERAPLDALRGGSPAENASLLGDVLRGRGPRAHASSVAINAGGLLWIAGRAESLRRGTELARDVLQSGRAYERLRRFVAHSQVAANREAPHAGG